MHIQTRRVNNGTSFFKQQGTLSKKISVRDAGVFGKSVNPIRNRGADFLPYYYFVRFLGESTARQSVFGFI